MGTNLTIQSINNSFKGKDILSLSQFDTTSINTVITATDDIVNQLNKGKILENLKGTVSTLLFFEPSSRTFSSFAAAIKRMGGQTIEYQNPLQTSSAVKGETLEDTIRVFEAYSDLIVIRHPEVGAPAKAAEAASFVPVMNAGDGAGEHPTQALLDLYTIHQKFGRLDNLKILMGGDLLYGRTIHSLLKGLSLYKNNTIYLLSPSQLCIPTAFLEELRVKGLNLVEIEHEEEIPHDCQVWYWTRVQKERFSDLADYDKVKNKFIITPELLDACGNDDMIIMHPLPRVGEIDVRVDTDPRAWYLPQQVKNGMYVRMALAGLVLGKI